MTRTSRKLLERKSPRRYRERSLEAGASSMLPVVVWPHTLERTEGREGHQNGCSSDLQKRLGAPDASH